MKLVRKSHPHHGHLSHVMVEETKPDRSQQTCPSHSEKSQWRWTPKFCDATFSVFLTYHVHFYHTPPKIKHNKTYIVRGTSYLGICEAVRVKERILEMVMAWCLHLPLSGSVPRPKNFYNPLNFYHKWARTVSPIAGALEGKRVPPSDPRHHQNDVTMSIHPQDIKVITDSRGKNIFAAPYICSLP